MDEPFGALDAMTRQTLQDEILQLVADKHIATVFITHDLEEAIYLGDRVVVLGGSPASVIENMEIDLPRPRNQHRREGLPLSRLPASPVRIAGAGTSPACSSE